ncbi:uncharacterized protein LOC108022751 [Drosophila biarmipes]|uniref:uncharacterized protein LOC108022751 n=1 Tax=Drosophila biarmipes TaxID=125945 RepID=UPI0007E5D561|nr:uncharacterized protein LOC108022751 [Drosophila biarmipes]
MNKRSQINIYRSRKSNTVRNNIGTMLKVVEKLIQLLRPRICQFAQSNKNISKHLYERARAEENIHFLKLQREQLKTLREKILSQKNEVTTKIIKVDKQIQSLEKTKTEDKNN